MSPQGRIFLSVITIMLLVTTPALSQVARGTIVGTVSDATGAVIPGVAVTITHAGTNQTRQVVTNEQGNYEASLLPIGEYRITAELPGFKTEVRQNVSLSVGDRLRIDFQMVVGEVSETVEVSAETSLVKAEDATMSAVMDQRKIVDLPLNGRDFTQLAYLIPGAFVPRENSHLGFRGGFTVAGVTERANQVLLDGVNNQGAGTHELSTPLIVDAIAEFRMQTNTYGAQYGTFAGGQVDAVSKSGTNEFHGNA
ncbi:MAG: carboxypeptidase regulatory-like domain-containing protein, partial [Acidobacteria bacterium]|nr:carboxypeptidase regulatory-like domain-containing protein [Acidobacteriota bacterium]